MKESEFGIVQLPMVNIDGRESNGWFAPTVPGIQIRPIGNQYLNDLRVIVMGCRIHQGGEAPAVLSINVRTSTQHQLCRLRTMEIEGIHKRRSTVIIGRIDISPAIQQQL